MVALYQYFFSFIPRKPSCHCLLLLPFKCHWHHFWDWLAIEYHVLSTHLFYEPISENPHHRESVTIFKTCMVVVISQREEMQEVRKPPMLLWLVSGQSDSSSWVHTFSLGLPGHSWRCSELSPVLHSRIILGGIRGPSECTMALTQDSVLPVLWAGLFPFPPTGVNLYLH